MYAAPDFSITSSILREVVMRTVQVNTCRRGGGIPYPLPRMHEHDYNTGIIIITYTQYPPTSSNACYYYFDSDICCMNDVLLNYVHSC